MQLGIPFPLTMIYPLTPSLSPSDGEKVAFRPGEGNSVHGPNAGAQLVETTHEPGTRLEKTASSPRPSPPEEERETCPALGYTLAMRTPITVEVLHEGPNTHATRIPLSPSEGERAGRGVRMFACSKRGSKVMDR